MRVYIGVQSRYIECGCPIPLLSGLFNFCCCWNSNQIYVPSQQKRASSSRLVCEALLIRLRNVEWEQKKTLKWN